MPANQFLCFLLTGGIAAGLNWGSRFLFSEIFRFEIAVFLAFLVGLLSGFFLMRLFVFSATNRPMTKQAIKYTAINILALFQTLLITLLFARWVLPELGIVEHAESLGHFVGVLVPVATSYLGHKMLTFR